MKKLFALPLAAVVALGACSDTATLVAPEGANFELVNINDRVLAQDVNARVRLSFAIPFEVEIAGGGTGQLVPVAQPNGPALSFPGNQTNRGSCMDGTWRNKNGNGMGGTLAQPHPHCTIYQDQGGSTYETVHVVLEPISARYHIQNANQHRLYFTNPLSVEQGVKILRNAGELEGAGEIVAWAVRQDNPSQRVGQITIDLAQFDGRMDDMTCAVSGASEADACLKQAVTFTYTPEPVGGIGQAGTYENAGFLWWESVGPGWYRAD